MTSTELTNQLPSIFAAGLSNGIIEGIKVAWPIFALCAIAIIARIILKK